MQSSPLVHLPKLKRLQISLPLEVCCSVNSGGVTMLGLTGRPKRAAIGTLSRKERLLLVPPDGLYPVLGCGTRLLLVGLG